MILIGAAVCIVLAVCLHRRTAEWGCAARPRCGDVIAACAALWVFALCLLLTGRPTVSALLCSIGILALWTCNESKKKSLRGEPLVFSDAALLAQAYRFPAFYLPFLPVKKMLAALATGCIAGIALWQWEAAAYPSTAWWLPLAAPVALGVFLRCRYNAYAADLLERIPLTFDPISDARRYGPLGAAALHVCWHLALCGNRDMGVIHARHSPHPSLAWPHEILSAPANHADNPDIFLVQAESFYDPRCNPYVPGDILANYDAVCREATHGTLCVNACGAYTMRTEFSVLTGAPSKALGTDAFNPYLAASRAPLWSLARHLRARGYTTLCIHPFDPRFFLRHRVIPNMGFERFMTYDDFPAPATFGPYVSDAFVAQSMLDALRESGKPLFCFSITMEAHGPWGDSRFSDREIMDSPRFSACFSAQEQRYLAHLTNADAMIAALIAGLRAAQRPATLGWYGDHPPMLPRLVKPEISGTPYFVWRNDGRAMPDKQDVSPESLGGMLLGTASTSETCRICA